MKLKIIVFFVLLIQVFWAQKINITKKKYSPSQLIQDVELMKMVYLKMHPVIGIYDDKKVAETGFNNLISGLSDSLTERDFRIKTRQFIRTLKCGHTDVLASAAFLKRYKISNFLPYYFISLNNELFVYGARNNKKDTLLKATTKVISINNTAAKTIIDFSKSLIPADGIIESSKKLYSQEAIGRFIIQYFNQPDSLLFEVEQNKIISKQWVKLFKSKAASEVVLKQRDTLYKVLKKAAIKYKYLDDSKTTCHIKIATFSHKKFSKAYKHIFKELNENKSKNLILDLRYNGGGSLSNAKALIKYFINDTVPMSTYTRIKNYPNKKFTKGSFGFKIARFIFKLASKNSNKGDTSFYTSIIKPTKKHHYNGNIYVLINGGSFSASCLVSAYLKNCTKAVLIGQETGGTEEGCNAIIMPKYKLPNTKIRFQVPSFRLLHAVYKKGNTGRGILPTYEITYTLEDYFNKKDLEIEKVKTIIWNGTDKK